MVGSMVRYRTRTSASPSAGWGTGPSLRRMVAPSTMPEGRVASRSLRFTLAIGPTYDLRRRSAAAAQHPEQPAHRTRTPAPLGGFGFGFSLVVARQRAAEFPVDPRRRRPDVVAHRRKRSPGFPRPFPA